MYSPIRKVKAAAIVGGAASLFGMFGVDFSAELKELLLEVTKAFIPLVPAFAAYFAKSKREDIEKVSYKD